MEYFEGGREKQIVRSGNTVTRPSGPWTPTIHSLLSNIRKHGFFNAPNPISIDRDGNEVVSYIHGDVSNYPLSESASSVEALRSAALLLRQYHDSTQSFLNSLTGEEIWWLSPAEPFEVICHGDYAPYNVVFQNQTAVGIIDFDTAHPGSRIWDISYALYRWVPLVNPLNPNDFGMENSRIERARLFCDSYGLSDPCWKSMIPTLIQRLQNLMKFMHYGASLGNDAFRQNIDDGHDKLYLDDIDYLKTYEECFLQNVTAEAANKRLHGTTSPRFPR